MNILGDVARVGVGFLAIFLILGFVGWIFKGINFFILLTVLSLIIFVVVKIARALW